MYPRFYNHASINVLHDFYLTQLLEEKSPKELDYFWLHSRKLKRFYQKTSAKLFRLKGFYLLECDNISALAMVFKEENFVGWKQNLHFEYNF